MNLWPIFLWVVLPYVSLTLFVAGHVWRYRHDQFGWTSRSTQLFERRWLAWGSNMFHYGALAAIGGHLMGMLIPNWLTSAVGISETTYRLVSAAAGSTAGVVCVVGFGILVVRRAYFPRVRRTTSPRRARAPGAGACAITVPLAACHPGDSLPTATAR